MKKNILITGGTGFLGSYIIRMILLNSDSKVNLLVRNDGLISPEKRCQNLIKYILKDKYESKLAKRIKVFRGDITNNNFGIKDNLLRELKKDIDSIYHCAAITGFRIPLDMARKVNVDGTRNILNFAKTCDRVRQINYISTLFIVGNKECTFTEDDLEIDQKFNNAYEQSKFEAELMVRDYKNRNYLISIFRPSIIVGDYNTGEVFNFKLLYNALRFFSLGLFLEFPAYLKARHNIVPVDVAAKAIYLLADNEGENIYHIASSDNILCYDFMDLSANFFKYKNPRWISPEEFNINKITPVQKKLIDPFMPYFNYKSIYSSKKTDITLQKYNFKYPPIDKEYLYRLFQYCLDSGFIKSA